MQLAGPGTTDARIDRDELVAWLEVLAGGGRSLMAPRYATARPPRRASASSLEEYRSRLEESGDGYNRADDEQQLCSGATSWRPRTSPPGSSSTSPSGAS